MRKLGGGSILSILFLWLDDGNGRLSNLRHDKAATHGFNLDPCPYFGRSGGIFVNLVPGWVDDRKTTADGGSIAAEEKIKQSQCIAGKVVQTHTLTWRCFWALIARHVLAQNFIVDWRLGMTEF